MRLPRARPCDPARQKGRPQGEGVSCTALLIIETSRLKSAATWARLADTLTALAAEPD